MNFDNHTKRMLVDHTIAAVLLALMVTPFDWGLAHEWLGVAFFLLFTCHQRLNRAWWHALGRGRWSAQRVADTAVDLAMTICVLGLLASSLVLSRFVLIWAPAVSGAMAVGYAVRTILVCRRSGSHAQRQ